jgi:hypothetical protein
MVWTPSGLVVAPVNTDLLFIVSKQDLKCVIDCLGTHA